MSLLMVIAAEDPNAGLKGVIDDAGPIAGLFVLALLIAVFFLFKSMSKQMKRIDPNLPDGRDDLERKADLERTTEAVQKGEAAASTPDEQPGA